MVSPSTPCRKSLQVAEWVFFGLARCLPSLRQEGDDVTELQLVLADELVGLRVTLVYTVIALAEPPIIQYQHLDAQLCS